MGILKHTELAEEVGEKAYKEFHIEKNFKENVGRLARARFLITLVQVN